MRAFAGSEINAFAVPGRKIGVFEGMYELTRDEAELAAVVGHEIAHVLEDHARERTNTNILRDLGLDLSRAALNAGDIQYAREIAALMGLGAQVGITLPYSRAHEREADRLGVRLMHEAGYDPRAAVRLWERMAERGPQRISFLSTHPAAADRADRLQRLVEEEYG
jgi:predicted Zn-dependent protease